MTDHNATVSWRDLREFAGVDLAKSFILSWHVEADTLVIDIDLFLEPDHPFYEVPRPAEKVCIRPACIEFPYCDMLQRDGGEAGKPVDIVGDLEHGAIADLAVVDEGRYALRGDFGTVSVIAERPVLKLTGP
jgi:hypothetical protein